MLPKPDEKVGVGELLLVSTQSYIDGLSSTHTAPPIQISQVSTQSLPYPPPPPEFPPSFISPHLPFEPPPSYPPHVYPQPEIQVPQQIQQPEVDLNVDQDEDVPDVE
ncbi:hypothetical protein TSUD_373210 [Trifolium subterraneum]|uniref:Uncharacterized protein n=1 Tax=Trifolium subterraneum TaxID=3900 RepID=A0A2Z6PJ72_TRISU|nr:hypothetical protein TSUD_373210 [Trifolium subterraneum]